MNNVSGWSGLRTCLFTAVAFFSASLLLLFTFAAECKSSPDLLSPI